MKPYKTFINSIRGAVKLTLLAAVVIPASMIGQSALGGPQWSKDLPGTPSMGLMDFNHDGKSEVVVTGSNAFDVYAGANGAHLWHLALIDPSPGSWGASFDASNFLIDPTHYSNVPRDFNGDKRRELLFVRSGTVGTITSGTACASIQVYNMAKRLLWQTPPLLGSISGVCVGQMDRDKAQEIVYLANDLTASGTSSPLTLVGRDGKTGAVQFTKTFNPDDSINLIDVIDLNGDGRDEAIYTVNNGVYACNAMGTVVWSMTTTSPYPAFTVFTPGVSYYEFDPNYLSVMQSWVTNSSVRQRPADIDGNRHRDLMLSFTADSYAYSYVSNTGSWQTHTTFRVYDLATKAMRWQTPDIVSTYRSDLPTVVESFDLNNVDKRVGLDLVCQYRNSSGNPVIQVYNGRQAGAIALPRVTKVYGLGDTLPVSPVYVDVNNDGVNEIVTGVNQTVEAINGSNGAVVKTIALGMPGYDIYAPCVNARSVTPAAQNSFASRNVLSDFNGDGKPDLVVQFYANANLDDHYSSALNAVRSFDYATKHVNWQAELPVGDVSVQTCFADKDPQQELAVFVSNFPLSPYYPNVPIAKFNTVAVYDGKAP